MYSTFPAPMSLHLQRPGYILGEMAMKSETCLYYQVSRLQPGLICCVMNNRAVLLHRRARMNACQKQVGARSAQSGG